MAVFRRFLGLRTTVMSLTCSRLAVAPAPSPGGSVSTKTPHSYFLTLLFIFLFLELRGQNKDDGGLEERVFIENTRAFGNRLGP